MEKFILSFISDPDKHNHPFHKQALNIVSNGWLPGWGYVVIEDEGQKFIIHGPVP